MTGIDPWRHVDADDDLVADFLAGTIEVVHELGGWLHPALVVVARSGHLHIEADAPDDELLVRLPAQAFLPISRVTWDDGPTLAFDDDDDALSDEQSELLMLQVALHNACDKLPTLMRTHPAVAADLPAALIDAVRAVKPGFRAEMRSPVSMFWSNRVLLIPPKDGAEPEPMALPIVDLLDHRSGGATGLWTGDAFAVSVAHAGAAPGCFLDYGYDRDGLDLAIDYGFVDDLSSDPEHPSRMTGADVAALEHIVRCAQDATSPAAATIARAARGQLDRHRALLSDQ